MIPPRPANVDRFLQGVGRTELIELLWRMAVESVGTADDVEAAASAVIVRLVSERGGQDDRG